MKPGRSERSEAQGSCGPCKEAEAQFGLHRDHQKATFPLKIVLTFLLAGEANAARWAPADGAKRLLASFILCAGLGAKGQAMVSKCVKCGAPLNEVLMQCGRCRASFPDGAFMDRKLVRPRPSIPLAAILTMGLLGALAFGGGKLAIARTVPNAAAVTASVNGKDVPVGGPAIALLEQQFSGKKVHLGRSGSERPVK